MQLYLLIGAVCGNSNLYGSNFERYEIEIWAKDDDDARRKVKEEFDYVINRRLFKQI